MQNINNKQFALKPTTTVTLLNTEEEVENVEYLDECTVDDVDGVNENLTQQHHRNEATEPFENAFYPNAIQCLISLYRDKYEQFMLNKTTQEIRMMYKNIWESISKDMCESYFEFDAIQVRQKFAQLRRQYFGVLSKADAVAFEYFQPFHEIYNDRIIASFLDCGVRQAGTMQKENQIRTYRDDALFASESQLENIDRQRQADEIAHKEHEFMDMVERELQAIEAEPCKEPGTKDSSGNTTTNMNIFKKRERQNVKETQFAIASKRQKANDIDRNYSAQNHQPEAELPETDQEHIKCAANDDLTSSMSLAGYNAAQQRRHEEKMSILRQNLLLQERAIDMQRQLLEELLKRV